MLNHTYETLFEGLIAQLEVNGWCVYTTNREFNALKTAIESENVTGRPFYSLRKIDDILCETYVIK